MKKCYGDDCEELTWRVRVGYRGGNLDRLHMLANLWKMKRSDHRKLREDFGQRLYELSMMYMDDLRDVYYAHYPRYAGFRFGGLGIWKREVYYPTLEGQEVTVATTGVVRLFWIDPTAPGNGNVMITLTNVPRSLANKVPGDRIRRGQRRGRGRGVWAGM
ncbi:uncharacterized protein SPPG_03031 [Spizellomyces punctatus DAOM BR117]|uniref:Uncharacterized protein n=1 Tax=Spizellomyces punctatus (strain DAOM BR117) TaxID=645134 RepID=A0A0L0HP59_SPIPD|nr:uncharacterized protein SPPG_03031 [Spizellomyces punctatus DAOM BR117]KND02574.1 hypothetical protein SPPG_03031 [Spizellomyces punctatus DAOM BR117]|eukprot:XP_016610613.1 hypothetical protein SPPG_03031 [Spizellomyces punctatus DAOM BR117]